MLTLSDMTWVSGIKVIRDRGFAACNLTLPAKLAEEREALILPGSRQCCPSSKEQGLSLGTGR